MKEDSSIMFFVLIRCSSKSVYKLKVTDERGCSGWGNVKVTVIDAFVDAGEDIHLCAPQSIQMNGQGIGSFQWSPATGLSDPNIANPIAMVTTTTTYTLTTTTPEGCIMTDMVTVFVHDEKEIVVSKFHPGCCNNDGEISLASSDSMRTLTYRWIPNVSTTNTAKGLAEGIYTIIATDQYGCETITNVDLFQECFCSSIVEQEIFYEEDGQICLPIKPGHINDFWMNYPVINTWGCGYENQIHYNPTHLPSFGFKGPYEVESWVVDGNVFKGEFRNVDKLIAWMNYVDSDADWALLSDINRIAGGHPDRIYGDLKVVQLSNLQKSTLTPSTINIRHSVILQTPIDGVDEIVVNIINKKTCCEDKIIVRPNPSSDARFRPELVLTAFAKDKQTQLQWLSNTGYKNQAFEIQRSSDGAFFETIGHKVNENLSIDVEVYSTIDSLPHEDMNYYRIKQLYTDGSFDFSPVQMVAFHKLSDFSTFPNPVEEVLNINLKQYQGMDVQITISNQYGQIVWQQASKTIEQPIEQIDTKNFDNGMYFIQLNTKKRRLRTEKVIVNRTY